jgi:hypothetical protein
MYKVSLVVYAACSIRFAAMEGLFTPQVSLGLSDREDATSTFYGIYFHFLLLKVQAMVPKPPQLII